MDPRPVAGVSSAGKARSLPNLAYGQQSIWDIRKRFEWCNVAVWANELPPDAKPYGDLELYSSLAQRRALLNVPGIGQ
jgi:sulfur-oxidizing protein SoxA